MPASSRKTSPAARTTRRAASTPVRRSRHLPPGPVIVDVAGLRLTEVERTDQGFEPVEGTERVLPAQLVLLAMGFLGPDPEGVVAQLGLETDERSNIVRGKDYQTGVPGVFVAGDAGRGQSLIVWAIAEGRAAANGVDTYLMGRSQLPRPINPTDRPLVV